MLNGSTKRFTAPSNNASDVEVIVVDDGSPERVADLLEDIDDRRLMVVRVPHAGLAEARNAGIRHERGRCIQFGDADDAFELDSTARLVRLAAGDDVITYGATSYVTTSCSRLG